MGVETIPKWNAPKSISRLCIMKTTRIHIIWHSLCKVVQRKADVIGIVKKNNMVSDGEFRQLPIYYFNFSSNIFSLNVFRDSDLSLPSNP